MRDCDLNCKNLFRNIQVTSAGTTLLGLGCDQICNLEVFASNSDDYFKYFNLKNDFCMYFSLFSYPEEIFAAYSSILMRIHVNLYLKFFSYFDLNIYDERKVREIMLTQSRIFLARFWHEVNIDFLYEFFDVFNEYNLSYCFWNSSKKTKFGPYYPAAFDATLTVIGL